jgi:hypothetical protein
MQDEPLLLVEYGKTVEELSYIKSALNVQRTPQPTLRHSDSSGLPWIGALVFDEEGST